MAALKVILAPSAPRPVGGCPVCGVAFADGEEVAVCDVDGTLHHPDCWRWHGERCASPGCSGHGALVTPVARPSLRAPAAPATVPGPMGPAGPGAPTVYMPTVAAPVPPPGYTPPAVAPAYPPRSASTVPMPQVPPPPPLSTPPPPVSRRKRGPLLIGGLVLLVLGLGSGGALFLSGSFNHKDELCFGGSHPCITGTFLAVWRQDGGTTSAQTGLLGAPLEDARSGSDNLTRQLFAYFQMEEAPGNQDPTRVNFTQLGNRLVQRAGPAPAPAPPNPNCLYFPETKHNLCGPFRAYWEGIGRTLAIPVLTDTRSVAITLLGYPISEELTWATDGQARPAQWFERARLEVVNGQVQPAPLGREISILGENTLPAVVAQADTATPVVPASPTALPLPPTYTPLPVPPTYTPRPAPPTYTPRPPPPTYTPRPPPPTYTRVPPPHPSPTLMPAPTLPVVSDGPAGRILFARGLRSDPLRSQIWIMDASGANRHAVTNMSGFNLYPGWSPRGHQIVFVSSYDQGTSPGGDLFVMNADGSSPLPITQGLHAKWPHWSPDGQWILYADAPVNATEQYDLYLVSANGGSPIQLTNSPGFDGFPAWTPDGRIVFASDRGDGHNDHLYIMNMDGSGLAQLTFGPGQEDYPAVSPQGIWIAYTSTADGGVEHIFTMTLDGTRTEQETSGSSVDRYPAWSPDGRWIAFHSLQNNNWDVYIMGSNGGALRRITTDPDPDDQPAWHR